MNSPSDQHHHPLRAANLDVWVAWDGGTVIVVDVQDTHDDDPSDLDNLQTPDGLTAGDPTSVPITVSSVTTDTIDLTPATWSAPQHPPTQSPRTTQAPPINPSTGLSTAMSETQAPSPVPSLHASSTTETLSLILSTTLDLSPSNSPPVSTTSISQNTSSSPSSAPPPAEPTTTALAPPLPHPPSTSSEYLSHSPPFYVAIALGSIAGVAILAALVAWAVRKQIHEKQRRLLDSAMKLPWVHSTGGTDPTRHSGTLMGPDVENGMRQINTEIGIKNLGSLEDMAHVLAWEPTGDRDVGEPRRADYSIDGRQRPHFIREGGIPAHTLFSGYLGPQGLVGDRSANVVLPSTNRVSLGTVDMHLPMETLGGGSALLITNQLPGDISACSSQDTGAPCPPRDTTSFYPDLGTPRELVPMPRFLGLDGKGLNIPWEQKPSTMMMDDYTCAKPRSRLMSSDHIRRTWERQGQNPSMDNPIAEGKRKEQGNDDDDNDGGWATSIRSNFAYAFNAVAAAGFPKSITTRPKYGNDGPDDKASSSSPMASKWALTRDMLRNNNLMSWNDDNKAKPSLSRGNTTHSTASNPWSLIETGTNAGVVHIHIPTSDVCSVSSHDISDLGYGVPRSYTLCDYQPLRIKKKSPTMVFSKRRSAKSSTKDSRSRGSSLSSSPGSSIKRHKNGISGSMKRRLTLEKRSALSSTTRTSLLTLTPSRATTVSVVTGMEDMAETRALAREALKVRRRKAEEQDEMSLG